MEKYILDEGNGLWYELRGDYYIPCLTVLDQDERPIGIWGQRHLRCIKQEHKALYTELLTSGRLNTYLADINEQATEQMLLLTKTNERRGANPAAFSYPVNNNIVKQLTFHDSLI